MSISALQPMSQDTISILERAGSRGNSTIRRPVGVKAPERAQESSAQTCHIIGNETDRWRREEHDRLLTVGKQLLRGKKKKKESDQKLCQL